MSKTILVPTDFSPAAANAADYAVQLAKELKARILLLHVYHAPLLVTDVPGAITDPDKVAHEKEEQLKSEAKRLALNPGSNIKYRLTNGLLIDEILEEEKSASLVVMGIKGAGFVSQALIGSMATTALRKSKKPLLVIPENAKYKAPLKIAFACDYEPHMDVNALNALKEFVKNFGSIVYVVNVKDELEEVGVDFDTSKKIENKLTNVKHIYASPRSENMTEELNNFIDEHNIDMLTVIPHHYNLLDRLFHKSISKKLAFHTHVPLLALPENCASLPGYML